uniref:Uncharacterized protein n=2 Tax=Leersia perrieri TaxID=77586 RepID=A0A0D9UYY2_9ORYZ
MPSLPSDHLLDRPRCPAIAARHPSTATADADTPTTSHAAALIRSTSTGNPVAVPLLQRKRPIPLHRLVQRIDPGRLTRHIMEAAWHIKLYVTRLSLVFLPSVQVRAGLWEAVVGGAASRTGSGGTDTVSGMRVRSGQWEGVAGNATRKISIWIQRWLGRGRPTRALWLAVGTRD